MIFAFILFSFLICGAHNPSQSFYRPVNRPLRLLTADIDTRYKISKKKAMYVIKSKKKKQFSSLSGDWFVIQNLHKKSYKKIINKLDSSV